MILLNLVPRDVLGTNKLNEPTDRHNYEILDGLNKLTFNLKNPDQILQSTKAAVKAQNDDGNFIQNFEDTLLETAVGRMDPLKTGVDKAQYQAKI